MSVWAFNKVVDDDARKLVYESIKSGKSRFGWSKKDENNLLKDNWTEDHSKQLFLLRIKPGDWIVHINTPTDGNCVAAKVTSEYKFDEGLDIYYDKKWIDFRHNFEIDVDSIIEFHRNDPNVLPNISRRLKLQGRYWQIRVIDDFNETIKNLKENKVQLKSDETTGLHHLRDQMPYKRIAQIIHDTHPKKKLEELIADVFRQIPNFKVIENGSGRGSDYGADLVIEIETRLPDELGLNNPPLNLVVQIKSYNWNIYDTHAVEQIETALKKYNGDMGLIITTAQKTDEIEKAIDEKISKLDKPINIIAGDDLARFVLKYYSNKL